MNLIEVENKEQYLKDKFPLGNTPKMDDKKYCLHCGEIITVGDYKVERAYNEIAKGDFDYIVCPNAPECTGTAIDWMPESWAEPKEEKE